MQVKISLKYFILNYMVFGYNFVKLPCELSSCHKKAINREFFYTFRVSFSRCQWRHISIHFTSKRSRAQLTKRKVKTEKNNNKKKDHPVNFTEEDLSYITIIIKNFLILIFSRCEKNAPETKRCILTKGSFSVLFSTWKWRKKPF